MLSPSEAGRSGEAVAQLASVSEGVAATGLDFEMYVKKAQQHVDSLAAQNELAKVYADTQNQLSKTQNSKDVAGVIEQSRKTLNDVQAKWSASPAAVQIGMSADALLPDLSRMGTVKQVDLMGKEFKITIDQQAEVLAANYANDRAAGGKGDMALGAFATAVGGGVKTGLVGDVEAQDMVRQFRQKGQELQIKNGISNANPDVNQKTYDDIVQNRDKYPDVTQEQLDVMKGQALSAFEAHTKMQTWAENQMAMKTLPSVLTNFTNPGTGLFDEGAALKGVADRRAAGDITEGQANVLSEGITSHQAQLQVGYKQEAGKRMDEIEKDLSGHKFGEASAKLEANKDWFEQHGLANDYQGLLRYTSQKKTEVRAEAAAARSENRYEYQFKREQEENNSQDQFWQVQHFITGGGVLTQADLQSMAGTGKGKMSTKYVDTAWKVMKEYQEQPDFRSALDYLNTNFAFDSKTASPDQRASANKKYADTFELFQTEANKHPEKSKLEIMHDIVKSTGEEAIKSHADAMFGVTPSTGFSFLKLGFSALFGNHASSEEALPVIKPEDVQAQNPSTRSAPIVQHSSATGKDRYSTDGGKSWLPGKPPQQ